MILNSKVFCYEFIVYSGWSRTLSNSSWKRGF